MLSWFVGFIPFVGANYSLSRLCCFLPYFLLGYTIANEDVFSRYKNEIFQKLNLVGYLVLIFIFIGWFIIITFRPGLTFATAFNDGYVSSQKMAIN